MKSETKGKPKYPQVKVNFPLDLFSKLEILAEDNGMTKAELLRTCIGFKLENVRKPIPKKSPTKEIKVDSNWRYEINKIGVNIALYVRE